MHRASYGSYGQLYAAYVAHPHLAPDCAVSNGIYYFYFPTDQDYIGVAVSDKPYGPFKDPLGKPLLTRDTPGIVADRDFIDPELFIDDDGTAYLFVGQNYLNAVVLNRT